jgi:hypothetical protein
MKNLLSVALASAATSLMPAADVSFMEPLIVPRPVEISVATNVSVDLKTVSVSCARDASDSVDWGASHVRGWFGEGVKVTSQPFTGAPVNGGDEAYELTVDAEGVRIRANALAGVRHAFSTLRQSAIAARGTRTTQARVLPAMSVRDRPAIGFRGMHLCWFPGVEIAEIERHIRMAAYYKFNVVVIEPWAVYRWRKHPDFCWPDASVTADDMKRLAGIGRDLGVAVCPQLNIFGHAAMSRFVGGKHATLDLNPRYEPLFEPLGGWNWCLSNPETRRLLADLVDDLYEACLKPPYFHIGCDEAHEPSCPVCRAMDYPRLVAGHISEISQRLTTHGARPLMWHDMLLSKDDQRWKGFYAKGGARAGEILASIPKNVVICDWFYEGPKKAYPTLDYFKAAGRDVLACPWQNPAGIAAQGAAVREKGLFGMLSTTWHRAYGRRQAAFLIAASHAGWGTSPDRYAKSFGTVTVATHLRHIGWDLPVKARRQTGFVEDDVPETRVVDLTD